MQVMVEDVAVKMSAQLFEASHGPGQMPPAGKPATHNPVHFHLFPFPADSGKPACSEAVWISMACILDARLLRYITIVITSQDFSSQEHTALRMKGSILLLLVVTAIAWISLSAADWRSSC